MFIYHFSQTTTNHGTIWPYGLTQLPGLDTPTQASDYDYQNEFEPETARTKGGKRERKGRNGRKPREAGKDGRMGGWKEERPPDDTQMPNDYDRRAYLNDHD